MQDKKILNLDIALRMLNRYMMFPVYDNNIISYLIAATLLIAGYAKPFWFMNYLPCAYYYFPFLLATMSFIFLCFCFIVCYALTICYVMVAELVNMIFFCCCVV